MLHSKGDSEHQGGGFCTESVHPGKISQTIAKLNLCLKFVLMRPVMGMNAFNTFCVYHLIFMTWYSRLCYIEDLHKCTCMHLGLNFRMARQQNTYIIAITYNVYKRNTNL